MEKARISRGFDTGKILTKQTTALIPILVALVQNR